MSAPPTTFEEVEIAKTRSQIALLTLRLNKLTGERPRTPRMSLERAQQIVADYKALLAHALRVLEVLGIIHDHAEHAALHFEGDRAFVTHPSIEDGYEDSYWLKEEVDDVDLGLLKLTIEELAEAFHLSEERRRLARAANELSAKQSAELCERQEYERLAAKYGPLT